MLRLPWVFFKLSPCLLSLWFLTHASANAVPRPGVGKTTVIREIARVLSDELHKRVVIVDTSNEIGGDGDVPHPAIGSARRMQVPFQALSRHLPGTFQAPSRHLPNPQKTPKNPKKNPGTFKAAPTQLPRSFPV